MTQTSAQPNLFDWAAAQRARDAAIEQVGANTSNWWMRQALEAIAACAQTGSEFTTDDVWRVMGTATANGPDGRAMGAAMTQARRAGTIEPTDRFRNSEQVSNHGRPKRLWRRAKTSEVTA